eukprot:TRINITY_DN542_c0_g2_i1.p1 TRINITY_DN542_c0_g2~~TRINITY_DN542_c0_g2_i1.p1  ORF type:complete len:556 (-),score=104.88 TRINITY_DN542_c0_g2_i1:126-1793(-)
MRVSFSLITFVSASCLVDAGLFLARLSDSEIKRVLLAEIEAAIGSSLRDVTSAHLSEIEDSIRTTFELLPKDATNRLGHDGVRYLLRRFFAQQHGWYVNGLHVGAEAWNSSEKSLLMRDHLPEVVQELFEARLGGRGSNLRDVVVLAATIEHLIRDELRGKLETVYFAKGFDVNAVVDDERARNLMEFYMILFLRGQDASSLDAKKVARLEARFHKQYPAWDALKALVGEVQAEATPSKMNFTFDDVSGLLELVADRFAPLYESQCNEMKHGLLDIEDKRSGRVRLSDFYRAALEDGMYQFTETIDAMRQYGILDETDPASPRVIIANYLGGQSNCVARTSFYSTCCPNSCEALLSRVEQKLGKYAGTPEEIVEAIEDPQSSLEVGFRGLTPWLRDRLDDLGKHHSGEIPFHGRLFAQWMHFVHPRDCMYPHVTGSTYQKHLEAFAAQMGRSSSLTMRELNDISANLKSSMTTESDESTDGAEDEEHCVGMWTMDEELFVSRTTVAETDDRTSRPPIGAGVSVTVAFAFVAFLVVQAQRIHKQEGKRDAFSKYMV